TSSDSERGSGSFFSFFSGLRVDIPIRRPPKSDQDDSKSEHRDSVLIFAAESPIAEDFNDEH
ncbi:30534_t:CDS:1, partial [Racocetra persica]